MKSRTGRLTDDEAQELLCTPRLVGGEHGGGVLVVGAAMTPKQWIDKYEGHRHPTTIAGWNEWLRDVHGDGAPTVFDADR